MTIKQFLASIGITNMDTEITTPETNEPENTPENETENVPENNTGNQNDSKSSINEQQFLAMQKELAELKAANARLLSQTPAEKEYTAQDALLELLGIGGNDGEE